MKIFLQLLLLSFCSVLHAEITYLVGDFSGKNLALDIELRVDQRMHNGILKNHEIKLNGQDVFHAHFELDQAQYVKLIYARNELHVFAEPGDTIFITIDPENFTYNSSFSGTNGVKNDILKHYYKNNQSAQRRSDRLQFKYGDFWYFTNTTIDEWMRTMTGQDFLLKMASRKDQWLAYSLEQEGSYPEAFKKDFGNYFYSEILYDWAYFMLIYGTTYHKRHELPADYLDFLSSVPVSGGHMASPRYQKYLMAYMNYLFVSENTEEGTFKRRYDFAEEKLVQPEQSFYLAELLIKQLKKKEGPEFFDQYYEYINSNPIIQYSERVSRKFNRLIYLSKGAEAPEFVLIDSTKAFRSKSDFLGRPVLINFWASWCKPCVAKFPELQKVNDQFKDQIHLVSINLDKSEESFIEALERWSPPGTQLHAPSEKQKSTMSDYGIKFLPGMLLIDREGRFMINPDEFDLNQLEGYLAQ